MPRIALRLIDAKEMARAIVPHVATDRFTPAITVAAIGGERFGSFIYATDRYTVGQYDLTNVLLDDGAPDEEMWIPRAALSWITTIGKAWLMWDAMADYVVVIETAPGANFAKTSVSFEYRPEGRDVEVHILRTFAAPSQGNFPPVHRLLLEFLAGERAVTHLSPDHLSKFTGYGKYLREPMRVTMPVTSERWSRMGGGPILIEIGKRFKGVIQPTFSLDGRQFGKDLAADNAARIAEKDPGFSTPQSAAPSGQDADATKEKEA